MWGSTRSTRSSSTATDRERRGGESGRRLEIGGTVVSGRGVETECFAASGRGVETRRFAVSGRGVETGCFAASGRGVETGCFAASGRASGIGRVLLAALFAAGMTLSAAGQNIRSHYVAKSEADGMIYHTFPVTLFEHPEAGDLTFDITYKEHRGGVATLNFTCRMERPEEVDSVRFASGNTVLAGPVGKLYLEPEKRGWKHRYTFDLEGSKLCRFFNEEALPDVTLYIGGVPWVYRAKRAAWRSYALIGYRIFEMIRVNEVR